MKFASVHNRGWYISCIIDGNENNTLFSFSSLCLLPSVFSPPWDTWQFNSSLMTAASPIQFVSRCLQSTQSPVSGCCKTSACFSVTNMGFKTQQPADVADYKEPERGIHFQTPPLSILHLCLHSSFFRFPHVIFFSSFLSTTTAFICLFDIFPTSVFSHPLWRKTVPSFPIQSFPKRAECWVRRGRLKHVGLGDGKAEGGSIYGQIKSRP